MELLVPILETGGLDTQYLKPVSGVLESQYKIYSCTIIFSQFMFKTAVCFQNEGNKYQRRGFFCPILNIILKFGFH